MKIPGFPDRLPGLLLPAAAALLQLACGCIVTESSLQKKLESLEAQIRTRGRNDLESLNSRVESIEKSLAEMDKTVKALEITAKALKTDILAAQGNISRVFEAADEVGNVLKKAEGSIEEAKKLRADSADSLSRMAAQVQDALKKYRGMLEEEKRLLSERIRFINSSLRMLEEGHEGKGD
jgi:archaellum component FlaC